MHEVTAFEAKMTRHSAHAVKPAFKKTVVEYDGSTRVI